jgi:integrase
MSKRGNNEGSIYKRAQGDWVASITVGYGLDGKRRRKSYYGKTRGEVSEKLKVALRDQQQGLPIITERQTLAQFLTRWLEDAMRPTIRASTYATYESHVRVHLKPALGHISLQQLTPQHIQSFLKHKMESGLSAHTTSDVYGVLRHALDQALKWGLVARNVAALVDKPRFETPQMKYLTPDQARALLQAVKGDRLEALYSVAIPLGLRRGEALGLRWEDIDLDKGLLHVRRALQRLEGKLQLVEPKTRTSKRSINLPQITIVALRAHRIRQVEERLQAGDKWREHGLVFTTTIGTPYEPNNLKRHLARMLDIAGLPHVRIHDLRHTAASLMLAQDIPPKVISEILGHSRTSITLDTYGHLFEPARQAAADKIDAIFGVI